MTLHSTVRLLTSSLGIMICTLLVTFACFGQSPVDTTQRWSWSTLGGIHGIDASKVQWLDEHLSDDEAVRIFELVDRLSSPGAAQLLVGRFLQDPSYYYLQALPETFGQVEALVLDSLSGRPPEGDAGVVHVAYLLARIRGIIARAYSTLPYYAYTFSGSHLELDVPRVPENRIVLDLDVRPAERLLRVIDSGDATPSSAANELASDVFTALIQHRSQSFYPVSISVEGLAVNLARAAGDAPLDRLYRYAFPVGLMHYAAVHEHLDAFRAVVRTIDRNEAKIVAHIEAAIVPYLPDDVVLTRTVHFLFADGADGWYADGIVGVDLEYFADDYDRLLNILVHETYHAAQDAVREARPTYSDDRLEDFAGVLEAIFREGTANFVAPTDQRSEDEAMQAAKRGAELLTSYHDALFDTDAIDENTLQHLSEEGVRGAGPFYWLGRTMAMRIVEQFGADRLAATIRGGGVAFARTYLEAAGQTSDRESLLNEEIAATLMRMD